MKKILVMLLVGILIIGLTVAANNSNTQNNNQQQNASAGEKSINQEKIKKNITFVPWQKRNESECLESCKCVGAVVSCPTETGKIMNITAGVSGNIITITVNKTNVSTELELEQEAVDNKTKLKTKLSNGGYAEIKIMPDAASETALQRLRLKVCSEENNCTIELKEVGKGEQVKLAYEVKRERQSKVFGLFKKKMQVQVQVNAEDGEIIKTKKPWWAFLASEPEEE